MRDLSLAREPARSTTALANALDKRPLQTRLQTATRETLQPQPHTVGSWRYASSLTVSQMGICAGIHGAAIQVCVAL